MEAAERETRPRGAATTAHRAQPPQRRPSGTGEERAHLGALTSLRFVAALGVVLYHYWAFVSWKQTTGVPAAAAAPPPPPTAWTRLAEGGVLGVDCFFVLSGFILAYTDVGPTGRLRGTRRAFWVARLARIYPISLVGLALDAVPFLQRAHHLAGRLANGLSQPLLLQAWVPSLGWWNSWNPPGWSLSVEAFFYLLFPFLLPRLARRSRRGLWAVAGLSWGLFAVMSAGASAGLPRLASGWHRLDVGWTLQQVLDLAHNPLLRLPEFTLGMALGLLYVRGVCGVRGVRGRTPTPSPTSSAATPSGPSGLPWDLALVGLGLGIVGLLLLPLPGQHLVRALVVPLFAAGISLLARERGTIAQLLGWRGAVWLGEVSYAVYIVHVPLWAWLAWVGQATVHSSPAAPALLPIYLASVLVVAGLSCRWIERPARAAIRARWTGWEARHAPTSRQLDRAPAASATLAP